MKGREFVTSIYPFLNPNQRVRWVDGQEQKTRGSDTTITTDEWSLLYNRQPGESWLYHLSSDPNRRKM